MFNTAVNMSGVVPCSFRALYIGLEIEKISIMNFQGF